MKKLKFKRIKGVYYVGIDNFSQCSVVVTKHRSKKSAAKRVKQLKEKGIKSLIAKAYEATYE